MDCRQVHQAYNDFLEEDLTPSQMEWIRTHIHDCPDCFLLDRQVRKSFVREMALVSDGD